MEKRNFLITGASRGIGFALTQYILNQGHNVFAVVRSAKSKGLEQLRGSHTQTLKLFEADVKNRDQLECVAKLIGAIPIDILINNAGVHEKEKDGSLTELVPEVFERTMATNVIGALNVTQTFLGRLMESDQPVLANISSLMGSIGDNSRGGSYCYRASKAALNMLTKNFALAYPHIISLSLHPGWVKTSMGGTEAPLSAEESASGLYKVITSSTKEHSGRFFDYKGEELPW